MTVKAIDEINNANDPLLNSYPPKKRHRMQQQHQDQQNLIQQQQQLLSTINAEKSPFSVIDETEQFSNESNPYNNNISQNEINSLKNSSPKNQETTNLQLIQKISSDSDNSMSTNHVKKEPSQPKLNELNIENQSQKHYEPIRNDSSANNTHSNGCCVSSNSSSTSLSPSSSPSIFMDSVSSTSSLSLVNNLSRVDSNQPKVNFKLALTL